MWLCIYYVLTNIRNVNAFDYIYDEESVATESTKSYSSEYSEKITKNYFSENSENNAESSSKSSEISGENYSGIFGKDCTNYFLID